MILNEAVTLLGYKVDERELERYKKQLRQQEAEALKLLNQRESRQSAALDKQVREAAKAANAQIRLASKVAREQEREANRAAAAQIRATERAARENERSLNKRVRDAQQANAKIARDAQKEHDKAVGFLRGGRGGIPGMGLLGGALSIGGLAAGAKSTYDTGVEREAMQIGLQNLPGMNKISAIGKFRELRNINASKAFGIEEAVKGFIRLKDMGLDASATALNAYAGIAASKPGKSMMDFVEAVADGVMGEAERLKEFGIKMKVEGDKAAITFRNQTVKVNRDAKSIEKALMDIGIKNYSKALSDAANSTAAKTRDMENSFKELKYQVWEGGLKAAFHNLIDGTSKLLKQWTPLAREFAVVARLNMPRYMKMFSDVLPFVNAGLALMLTRFVGLKYLAAAEWAYGMANAFKTLGAGAFYAESGLKAMVVGGSIVALSAILADFIYYLNTGDSKLVEFTKKWPTLSNAIKDGMYWNKIFIEALIIGFQKIGIKINDTFQKMKIWFTWLKEEIERTGLLQLAGNVLSSNRIIPGVTNMLFGGPAEASTNGGASNMSNPLTNSGILGPGFAKNQKLGQSLAQLAPSIREVEKYCLRAVWRIQNAALNGTSKIEGGAAYLAADFLARDKRFKEVKFTPAMYKKMMEGDSQLKALMQGATVIYNRQSGFSPRSGHAEIWDTQKQKSFYGLGATSMQRSDQMINNARFFIPVQQQPMPVPANRSNQVSSLPPIMIEQTFTGQVSPAQVKGASNAGVQQGLHRASLSAAQGMA